MKDLIILGNGMAGMTAALYAKRANLDFKIVGRDEYDFGQIGNAILVENFPCVESQSGFELATKLHDQLNDNGIEIEEHEVAVVSELEEGGFTIKYSDGTEEYARTVIYALGASHRQLNCEIEEGIPIHYCALCDGALYQNKTVAVIGGGDAAFTQAEYLAKICREVRIIMCDRNITASPSTFKRVKSIKNIHINYDFLVGRIYRNKPEYPYRRSGILTIEEQHSGKGWSEIEVDGVFVAIGMKPNTTPINLTVCNSQGYINANENGICVECPGFFAAGDCRTKTVRQGITAAADGANAVQSVINYLKKFK